MENIQKRLPQVVIYLALGKFLTFGVNYAEVLGFLVFCSYTFLKEHYEHKKEYARLEAKVDSYTKELDTVKTTMSALKISQNMRQMNVR